MLQQDNAPAHKSRSTMQFFAQNGLDVLPWPPHSPHLNPCENLWTLIKGRLEDREIHGRSELRLAVDQELQILTESMSRRVQAVIAATGGTTNY